MYPSTTNERDGGYPKGRENGYNREPYDDRDWFRRGEFVRDPISREDRERDFHRHRGRREWPEREYRHIDVSPSPKRRKLGREDIGEYSSSHYPFNGVPHKDTPGAPFHKPKDYKRPHHGYESPRFGSGYRSPSRSPSPPPNDKERYPRDYYDRESFSKPHSSYRDRESEYPVGRNNFYRDVPHYNNSMRSGWDNRGKYDYRTHNYENNNTYRPYDSEYRNSEGRSYDRVDYDRERYDRSYDREWKDSYNSNSRDRYPRDSHDYDKEHREPDRTFESTVDREAHAPPPSNSSSSADVHVKDKPKDRSGGYYSPYDREFGEIVTPSTSNAPPFQDDRTKQDNNNNNSNSPAASSNTNTNYDPAMPSPPLHSPSSLLPTSGMDFPEEKPTPKKRLGWGQGLVAFEKEKQKDDTPTMETRPPPEIKMEPTEESPLAFDSPAMEKQPPEQPANQMEVEPAQPPVSIMVNSEAVEIQGPKEEPVKEEPEEPKTPLPSKEDVLLNIEKLDAEIAKTEMMIQNLKKPKKPDHKHGRLSHHDIILTVFEENKEKIKANSEELSHMAHPQMANQTVMFKKITDIPVYKENLNKHNQNRAKISSMIVSRKQQLSDKERQLVDTYKKLYESWKKKIQRLEEKKRKREEKQKQRDKDLGFDHEAHQIRRPILRSSVRGGGRTRIGSTDAVRSEAEMEEVINQLKMEEELDPVKYCLKTVATIPAMMLDRGRIPSFIDNNGLVQDPMTLERERKGQNPWTEEEKSIFFHRYLQFPKCFSKIATFLENKNTQDVICYYYMNKKTLDLKKALREQPRRRPKANLSTPRANGSSRELSGLGVNSTTPSRNSSKNDFEIDKRRESFPEKNIGSFAPVDDSTWTDSERDLFAIALSKFSKDFKQISDFMGTKNPLQCQNYYHNYNKKYNLDQIAEEAAMNLRGEKASRSKTKALMNSSVTTTVSTPTSSSNNNNTSNAKTPTTPKGDEPRRVYWTASEKSTFIKCFKLYGKNWKKIAMEIPTKSQNQIRNYFQNYKVKLGLDQIEPQFPPESDEGPGKKRGRKPTEKPEKEIKEKTKKRRGKDDKDKDSAPTTPSANYEDLDDEDSMDVIERVSSVEEVINITSNSMDQTDLPELKKESSDPALTKELSLLSNESLDSEMPVDVTSEVAAALTDFSFFAQRLSTPSPVPAETKPQERLTVVEVPPQPSTVISQAAVISQVISSSITVPKEEPASVSVSVSVSLSAPVESEVQPMAAEPTDPEPAKPTEPVQPAPEVESAPVVTTPPLPLTPPIEETAPQTEAPAPMEEEPTKETDVTILYEDKEASNAPEVEPEAVTLQDLSPQQAAEEPAQVVIEEPVTEVIPAEEPQPAVEEQSAEPPKPAVEESSLINDNAAEELAPVEEPARQDEEAKPASPLNDAPQAEEAPVAQPEAEPEVQQEPQPAEPAESEMVPQEVGEELQAEETSIAQPEVEPAAQPEVASEEAPQHQATAETAQVEEPVAEPAVESNDPMEVVESSEAAPSEEQEEVMQAESPDSEVTNAAADDTAVNTEHQSVLPDSCSSSSAISSTDEVAMIESQT